MFKTVRIAILLLILFVVSVSSYLSRARSTDWNNPLYLTIYPINADGSDSATQYIERLELQQFEDIERFVEREAGRYGQSMDRPLRILLGEPIAEQPPDPNAATNPIGVMLWSLKMRWWAGRTAGAQDSGKPDVRMFVRYHAPGGSLPLDNSVGLQKGMLGIVNGYASRRRDAWNNVVIAHEFLHTLGATDKYDLANGQPLPPHGLAEPDREPLYPQRYAEIMGGRVALAADRAEVPRNLERSLVGELTASEIGLR